MGVEYLDKGNDDGTIFGQSYASLIGFYGLGTAIARPTVTGTYTRSTASVITIGAAASTVVGFTVYEMDCLAAFLNDIRAQLVALGLVA